MTTSLGCWCLDISMNSANLFLSLLLCILEDGHDKNDLCFYRNIPKKPVKQRCVHIPINPTKRFNGHAAVLINNKLKRSIGINITEFVETGMDKIISRRSWRFSINRFNSFLMSFEFCAASFQIDLFTPSVALLGSHDQFRGGGYLPPKFWTIMKNLRAFEFPRFILIRFCSISIVGQIVVSI